MASPADAIVALISSARGARPHSLDNLEVEEALNISLALLVELAVSNERIDRLERLLAERVGLPLDELRQLRFDGTAAEERQASLDALMARVLRILIDPREPKDRAA
ncbi:MAG: hypothetical protein WDM86_21135 [Rhizomicrobium sp.]